MRGGRGGGRDLVCGCLGAGLRGAGLMRRRGGIGGRCCGRGGRGCVPGEC